MKKKIFALTMAVVLLGSGAAFAGQHHHMGPGREMGRGMPAYDSNWIEQAPQNVQDAFKQMDISRSEMRLEIAKGNTDSKKLTPLHNNILKARRTVADYYFDQGLKNPRQAARFMDGHHRMGMRMIGGSFSDSLFSELRSELSKTNPNTVRAKQLYTDMMNLSEKHAKEGFELMLKYPESINTRRRSCIF